MNIYFSYKNTYTIDFKINILLPIYERRNISYYILNLFFKNY